MSSSVASNRLKVTIYTILSVVVSIGCLVLWLPRLNHWRHATAASLRQARVGDTESAKLANLYAATLLEPRNQAAILELADRQITDGDLGSAGETLKRLPGQVRASRLSAVLLGRGEYREASVTAKEGIARYGASFELEMTEAKAELEAGRARTARDETAKAIALQPTSIEAQLLYGLAGLVVGEGSGATNTLVSDPEAARRVSRAQADQVALAQELYTLGLLEAPKAILSKLPPSSTEILRLQAQITLSRFRPSNDQLRSAAANLHTAIQLHPADPSLWELLATTERHLGDVTATSDAESHLARLKAARP